LVQVWDLDTPTAKGEVGKVILTLEGHSSSVVRLAFSPDGKRLATVSWDRTAKIWDMETPTATGKINKAILTLEGQSEHISCIAFSPDGRQFATGSMDSTVKIWNLPLTSSSTQIPRAVLTLKGHSKGVETLYFSPDGKRLTSVSWDNMAIIWNVDTIATSGPIRKIPSSPGWLSDDVMDFVVSSDGMRLVTLSFLDPLKLWDWDSTTAAWKISKADFLLEEYYTREINGVAISPDGGQLAIGLQNKYVEIVDLYTPELGYKSGLTLAVQAGKILRLTFSPDGKRLAALSDKQTVSIWNLIPLSNREVSRLGKTPAGLIVDQLITYDLDDLLDLHPDNEQKLLNTGDTWQIAAFADLYAEKINKTGHPKAPDYKRARRLYQACLASNVDNPYFEKKLAELERVWKERAE
jgi:WD40 repeat protein